MKKKLVVLLFTVMMLFSFQGATSNAQVLSAKETNVTVCAVPTEYKNALYKAKEYNRLMYMSKRNLYNQLTSKYGEGFSKKAATYAVNHVNANWNKNALRKAKDYRRLMKMSKKNIYRQLVSKYGEGFTKSQAKYAINHLK